MRRTVLIAIAAVAAVAAVPVTAAVPVQTASPVKAHVSPGTGGPHTTFTVSFRNPAQTGQLGSTVRANTVYVQGTNRPGCVWSGQIAAPTAAAKQMIRVALTASHMSGAGAGAWCAGTFHGTIVQSQHFTCAPPHLCPMIAIRPQTIAHFSFRVKRHA